MAYHFTLTTAAIHLPGGFAYKHVGGDTVYYGVNNTVGSGSNIGTLSEGQYLDREVASWASSAGQSYLRQENRSATTNASIVNPADSSNATYDATTRQFKMDQLARLDSPTFTGDPTAPTPSPGDNDTSIATTAFVTAADVAADALKADIASPTFTGDPKAPTPSVGDNDTSIATTAFVRSSNTMINVKDYGAIGDWNGTTGTDDTTAIQDALTAAAVSGGTVFIPAGTYLTTASLEVGSNTQVLGEGKDSIIAPAYSSTGPKPIINDHANGNENITLRDFAVDKTGTNVEHGIMLNGVTNLLLDGIYVFGETGVAGAGAIAISSILPSNVLHLVSTGVRVVNCHLTECGNYGVQVGFVKGCSIANNYIQGYRELVGVEPEKYTPTAAISQAQNVSITGNVLKGSATSNGTATGMLIVTQASEGTVAGVSVTGNTLYGPATTSSTGNPGILIDEGSGISVMGNSVTATEGPGIIIGISGSGLTAAACSGNNVNSCATYSTGAPGIALKEASGCVVVGNKISGSNHTYGISETGNSVNNLITNNYSSNANNTPATGSVYAGNKTSSTDPDFITKGKALAAGGFGTSASPKTMADDSAASITFSSLALGLIIVSSNTATGGQAIVAFRVGDAYAFASIVASSGATVTALAAAGTAFNGTSGTDGHFSFGPRTDTPVLTFINRTAGQRSYSYTIINLTAGVTATALA